MASTLVERFQAQDERALARLLSWLEAGMAEGQDALQSLRRQQAASSSHSPQNHIIGITGSPGSGKSTLTDKLIGMSRAKGRKVAVLAVDPSSPFSGGAILGDRIRMTRWHHDSDVFIRSMATKGHLGGLAGTTMQALALLQLYGFEDIYIETVGVGQSEVDIVNVADSTLLVLTPGQGDGVQAFKAGIMEIADIFIINKFDFPGARRLKREVKAALELTHPDPDAWYPPVMEAIASQNEGIEEIYATLQEHYCDLGSSQWQDNQRKRARFELLSLLQSTLQHQVQNDALVDKLLTGELTAQEALQKVLH